MKITHIALAQRIIQYVARKATQYDGTSFDGAASLCVASMQAHAMTAYQQGLTAEEALKNYSESLGGYPKLFESVAAEMKARAS